MSRFCVCVFLLHYRDPAVSMWCVLYEMLYLLVACVWSYRSSSGDDYCPAHQVDFIQASVIHMLETVYGDLDVKLNYAAEAELS